MTDSKKPQMRWTTVAMVKGCPELTDLRMEFRTDGAGKSEIVVYDRYTDNQWSIDTSGSSVIDDLIAFTRDQIDREAQEYLQPDYFEKRRRWQAEEERKHLEKRLQMLNSQEAP